MQRILQMCRLVENPFFFRRCRDVHFPTQNLALRIFLLKDEIHYIKNEVGKIPIDFSTA